MGRRGIELSSWGPDLYANIVVVGLRHYSPARAAYLAGFASTSNLAAGRALGGA